jgi:hypothetical protein
VVRVTDCNPKGAGFDSRVMRVENIGKPTTELDLKKKIDSGYLGFIPPSPNS